ncbi:MAG TPA: hypothetical protein VGD98_07450 [Ktedonobacteraceae bacterium]
MPHPPSFSEHREQWQTLMEQEKQQAEIEGRPLDAAIAEATVVLNQLGIANYYGPPGLLERSPYAPWISIQQNLPRGEDEEASMH